MLALGAARQTNGLELGEAAEDAAFQPPAGGGELTVGEQQAQARRNLANAADYFPATLPKRRKSG